MKKDRIPPVLTGVAGEYFVAAELSRRGYIASISLRNTRGIDILATNQDGSRSITIQCKTGQGSRRKWLLNEKAESFESAKHFYVFVSLGNPMDRPRFHIGPSKLVAERTRKGHKKWLATPGRKGQKHQDTAVRQFADLEDEFLEKWELLGLG
jgi:hypothetical protein